MLLSHPSLLMEKQPQDTDDDSSSSTSSCTPTTADCGLSTSSSELDDSHQDGQQSCLRQRRRALSDTDKYSMNNNNDHDTNNGFLTERVFATSIPQHRAASTTNTTSMAVVSPQQCQIGRKQRWLIPADHPLKLMWDILTFVLSIATAYTSHTQIRDRSYQWSPFCLFCQVVFSLDIMLNFFTEHKSFDGSILANEKSVWARYLTTWFAVDACSLVPWEQFYIKPIIEMQNKRGFFKKSFFRTKAVFRVTRFLRTHHFKWFGEVASHTRKAGVGARSLLRLLIKYVPKYLMFYRNMRAILLLRVLRFIRFVRRVRKGLFVTGGDVFYSCPELVPEEEEQLHVAT